MSAIFFSVCAIIDIYSGGGTPVMSLSSKIKVRLPDKGLIIRRSGKYHYVYKVLQTYRTEKGQPTNKRRAIGKLDEESGLLIPNDTYWEFYENCPEFPNLALSNETHVFDSV